MNELKKDTLDIEVWTNWWENDARDYQVIGIDWSCNLGVGRYELYIKENGTKISAFSEHMDSNDDKKFLMALLEKITDMAEVVE